jgi:transcriptional regulator with PAS, ATPase and Fis domain
MAVFLNPSAGYLKSTRDDTAPTFGLCGQICASQQMQRVYQLIHRASHFDFPILILGESGTGKELVARAIHFGNARRSKPFVPVDCSSLVPTLIESELFGYVKGAFTGAHHSRPGLLETGNGGTVFLDEVGELPVNLQAKLLRVLQEHEIRPVGATHRVPIDVRIIAATNRDLGSAIRAGTFRQDLYFRLNVMLIQLPPLRERKSDIPLLIDFFLERSREAQRPMRTISEDAMRQLMAYDWPGNVRELENAVESGFALASGPILHSADLPATLRQGSNGRTLEISGLTTLEELKRHAILRALRETKGHKVSAARLLGIGKTTLYRKLKQYARSTNPSDRNR